MYLAMRLCKKLTIETALGEQEVDCTTDGRAGFVPVFETKEAAREMYGDSVTLLPIGVDQELAFPCGHTRDPLHDEGRDCPICK